MKSIGLSLPIKLAITSFIISVIGVFALVIYSFHSADILLKEQSMNRIREDLNRETSILKLELQTVVGDIRNIANNPALKGIARAIEGEGFDEVENMSTELWKERLRLLFSGYMTQRNYYTQIRLISKEQKGQEIFRMDKSKNGEQIDEIEEEHLQNKGVTKYYQKSIDLDSNEVYISDINLNREHGNIVLPVEPTLRFATPIIINNKVFGVIVINTNFMHLARSLYQSTDQTHFILTNDSGDYLIHPNEDWRFSFEFGRKHRIDDEYIGLITKDSLNSHEKDKFYTSNFEKKKLGIVYSLFHFDNLNPERFILLGAVASYSYINSQSNTLWNQMILGVVLISILICMLSFFFSRYLTLPINQLTNASIRIANGERNVQLPTPTADEVGVLSNAMKTMMIRIMESKDSLKKSADELEIQVEERTEELKIAKNKAEELAKVKSAFLANMSHEIRTPMNGVLGMTQLLCESNLTDEQLEMARTIESCGEGLLAIINDILDYSKLEAGKVVIESRSFKVKDFIEHVVFLFSSTSSHRQIGVECVIDENVPDQLIADDIRIRQIVSNLLSNAIKFSYDKGKVWIYVTYQNSPKSALTVSIEDKGIGIKEENLGKLFKEFTQEDISTTRKFGGTGLGLSISLRLAKLMGGDILVESEYQVGTRMTMVVPVQLDSKGQSFNGNSEEKFLKTKIGLSGHKVLVVEDNPINQKIAKAMLLKFGISCEVALNGVEALEKLEKGIEKYSLIFMDMQMPVMDGIETTEKIIDKYRYNRPKIIAMTANAFKEDKEKCLNAGMDDFMAKPIQKKKVELILRKYLEVN